MGAVFLGLASALLGAALPEPYGPILWGVGLLAIGGSVGWLLALRRDESRAARERAEKGGSAQ